MNSLIPQKYLIATYLWVVLSVSIGLFFIPNIAFSTLNGDFAKWGLHVVLPNPLGNLRYAFTYGAMLGFVLLTPYFLTAKAAEENE